MLLIKKAYGDLIVGISGDQKALCPQMNFTRCEYLFKGENDSS